MRLIRMLLTLVVIAVAGLVAYNYMNGRGLTLSLPSSAQADGARSEIEGAVKSTTEKAGAIATKVENAVTEGTLTTKIKAKMALDDLVKARDISVETTGATVTLTGRVSSAAERDRAVRIAKETEGVTKVVDKLAIRR